MGRSGAPPIGTPAPFSAPPKPGKRAGSTPESLSPPVPALPAAADPGAGECRGRPLADPDPGAPVPPVKELSPSSPSFRGEVRFPLRVFAPFALWRFLRRPCPHPRSTRRPHSGTPAALLSSIKGRCRGAAFTLNSSFTGVDPDDA